jgi:hypothetical protein
MHKLSNHCFPLKGARVQQGAAAAAFFLVPLTGRLVEVETKLFAFILPLKNTYP